MISHFTAPSPYRTISTAETFWKRIQFYPDGIETLPENVLEEIYDEINPPERVYKKLEDYSDEEKKQFPWLEAVDSAANRS